MLLLDPAALMPSAFQAGDDQVEQHCLHLASWLGGDARGDLLTAGPETSMLVTEHLDAIRGAIPSPWNRTLMDALYPLLQRHTPSASGVSTNPVLSPQPVEGDDDAFVALTWDVGELSGHVDAIVTRAGRWPADEATCSPPPPGRLPLVDDDTGRWFARTEPPADWLSFARRLEVYEQCSEGAIAFTDSALKGVRESKYPRMEELWTDTALLAEAAIAFRAAQGDTGARLDTWLKGLCGLNLALTDSNLPKAKKRFTFEGDVLSREPHIKVADRKHGKSQSGRIYFALDINGSASRFIVDHIGCHL